ASSADVQYYAFDDTALDQLRKSCPWKDDPRYFKKVSLSPSSVMKMMTHCHSGVEKGTAKGGNPIEVMGLLLGRPSTTSPSLIVTDVFPLPIEGFETRVIADDGDVINHMIALGESLETTRKEKFMGWYHSHPFEVGVHSHCFLSQTDISTQLQWQRAEDPHGNPFLAIVVDPLRSLAKNTPILKAFRAYPPEYTHPVPHTCPDGSVIREERGRLEQWGSCWSAYYELEVEYFMSSGARNVMSLLTQNFLWMRTLGSSAMLEGESRGRYPERVEKAAERLRRYDVNSNGGGTVGGAGGGSGVDVLHPDFEQPRSAAGGTSRGRATSAPRSTVGGAGGAASVPSSGTSVAKGGNNKSEADEDNEGELGKACQAVVDIATEKLIGNIAQVSKRELFS
ncbi:hypothetical protein HJC23_005455, partial [Cyclotella cryptica]